MSNETKPRGKFAIDQKARDDALDGLPEALRDLARDVRELEGLRGQDTPAREERFREALWERTRVRWVPDVDRMAETHAREVDDDALKRAWRAAGGDLLSSGGWRTRRRGVKG